MSVADRDSIWCLSDTRQYILKKNVCLDGPDAGPGDRPGPASTQVGMILHDEKNIDRVKSGLQSDMNLQKDIFLSVYSHQTASVKTLKFTIEIINLHMLTLQSWLKMLKTNIKHHSFGQKQEPVVYNNNHQFTGVNKPFECAVSEKRAKISMFSCKKCRLVVSETYAFSKYIPYCKKNKHAIVLNEFYPNAFRGKPHENLITKRNLKTKKLVCRQTGDLIAFGSTYQYCQTCKRCFKPNIKESYLIDNCFFGPLSDKIIDVDISSHVAEFSKGLPVTVDLKPTYINSGFTSDDFEIISVLGQGSFATCYAAKVTKKGKNYPKFVALKVIEKSLVIKEGVPIEALENEQRTFEFTNTSKNLCKAYGIWQDESRLYFALENLPNRDLWYFVKENIKTKGPQRLLVCQYYGTEIAMGLSFLHSKSIIHRDLKLENIVLDAAGHAKLIDFGMVGFLKEKKCTSFVGSVPHLAPEIVEDSLRVKGYSKVSDFHNFYVYSYR